MKRSGGVKDSKNIRDLMESVAEVVSLKSEELTLGR